MAHIACAVGRQLGAVATNQPVGPCGGEQQRARGGKGVDALAQRPANRTGKAFMRPTTGFAVICLEYARRCILEPAELAAA